MRGTELRQAREDDYAAIAAGLQTWWTQPGVDTQAGARERAALVPRLWLQHFANTSVVAERAGGLVGFLIGFLSPDRPDEGYIHFVGVAPDARGAGVGRSLYERFFESCRKSGRTRVRCITSPQNAVSIAFHAAMGFESSAEPREPDRLSRRPTTMVRVFIGSPSCEISRPSSIAPCAGRCRAAEARFRHHVPDGAAVRGGRGQPDWPRRVWADMSIRPPPSQRAPHATSPGAHRTS
ncbi:MAG: GNAT family N-acetyltransferase [Polyangiaceae bacterium]